MSHRVLIVDDSPVMRKMIARALAISGLDVKEVLHAADGRDALEVLARTPVQLLLADVNMPGMNGVQLVEAMAQRGALSRTRVVMVSSDRSPARVEQLKALGVRGYLTKPFRPEQLFEAVAPLLAGPAP